jgi:hypothetical protein
MLTDKRKVSYLRVCEKLAHRSNELFLDYDSFVSVRKIARFVDLEYGEFFSRVDSVINGVSHKKRAFSHIRYSNEEINEIVIKKSNNTISLKIGTYTNMNNKCIFIDKDYGEFEAWPQGVFYKGYVHPNRQSAKKEASCLAKYGTKHATQNQDIKDKVANTNVIRLGVPYPAQSRDVAIKQAISRKNSRNVAHWKSGEMLVCSSSYETAVAEFLNKYEVEYEWQPKTFKLPNNQTYRPDLYLNEYDTWVEIKGYMYPHSEIKCSLFKNMVDKYEIWDTMFLKNNKII